MHKAIVNSLTDEEFSQIINSSSSFKEAAKKMGFAHEPGKGSKEKIRLRMKKLNLNFPKKEKIEKVTKVSLYSGGKEIGFVGEKAFEFLCAKNKIDFFREPSDSKPYDYIIKLKDGFKTLQVKTTEFSDNGVAIFKLDKSRTEKKDDKLVYTRKVYKEDDKIDYFFLYCIETDDAFLLDGNSGINKRKINIRLNNSKNCQAEKCNLSKDYLFTNKIKNLI